MRPILPRLFWLILLLALLAFALRNTPLSEIWLVLHRLHPGQIATLLIANALVILLITLRWWLIARATQAHLPFLPLLRYRLTVFGLSYFTPGPQVGGEPLQVFYLHRLHCFSLAHAISTVVLDKLLELLGNFLFIGAGLVAMLRAGLLLENGTPLRVGWEALAALMVWPALHIVLLYRGRKPVSQLLRAALSPYKKQKWFRLVEVSEHLAAAFIRRRPRSLLAALTVSLLAWGGMAGEYGLMLSFLGIHLSLWQMLAALTASLLAFLLPLPGGLGALEASQVLALGAFGVSPSAALSLTLLMRARDLLNGGLGLLFSHPSEK